jgi:hypothetical protein
MKTRLLGALVGLAISFALPTFAQQKETVDIRKYASNLTRSLRSLTMHPTRPTQPLSQRCSRRTRLK